MLLNIIILLITIYVLIELNHRFRIDSPLRIKPKDFNKYILDNKQKYIALVEISNIHKRMEVMIPFFKVSPKAIGISHDDLISLKTTIKPIHPDEEDQKNDYWYAYIVKSKKSTFVKIEIEYEIKNIATENLKCLWLDIEWGNYGPFGFYTRFDGFVLPDFLNPPQGKNSTKRNHP